MLVLLGPRDSRKQSVRAQVYGVRVRSNAVAASSATRCWRWSGADRHSAKGGGSGNRRGVKARTELDERRERPNRW